MKLEDLKTKSVDELSKLLLDTRKEQFNLRFQKTGGSLDNTSQIRKSRRTVARIKTLLSAAKGGAVTTEPKAPKKKAPAKKTTKAADKAA